MFALALCLCGLPLALFLGPAGARIVLGVSGLPPGQAFIPTFLDAAAVAGRRFCFGLLSQCALLQHALAQGDIGLRRQDAMAHVVVFTFQNQEAGFSIDDAKALAENRQLAAMPLRLDFELFGPPGGTPEGGLRCRPRNDGLMPA